MTGPTGSVFHCSERERNKKKWTEVSDNKRLTDFHFESVLTLFTAFFFFFFFLRLKQLLHINFNWAVDAEFREKCCFMRARD